MGEHEAPNTVKADPRRPYKALAAFATAAGGALASSALDGAPDGQEWVFIAGTGVIAALAVFGVPNPAKPLDE